MELMLKIMLALAAAPPFIAAGTVSGYAVWSAFRGRGFPLSVVRQAFGKTLGVLVGERSAQIMIRSFVALSGGLIGGLCAYAVILVFRVIFGY
jgi:hypothetical protein